jgi:hypothetical protein
MEVAPPPAHILTAEKIHDAVFVEFDDGKFALYPASLLYASLPHADAVNLDDTENGGELDI